MLGLIRCRRLLSPILADRKIALSTHLRHVQFLTTKLHRPRGNATANSPSGGFSQPGLAALFNPSAPSPSTAPGPSTSPSPPQIPPSRNRTAVIAGSVTAGVIFLGLLSSALYFTRNRLRQRLHGMVDARSEHNGAVNSEVGAGVELDGTAGLQTDAPYELKGATDFEMDGGLKQEMDARQIAIMEIMSRDVPCEASTEIETRRS